MKNYTKILFTLATFSFSGIHTYAYSYAADIECHYAKKKNNRVMSEKFYTANDGGQLFDFEEEGIVAEITYSGNLLIEDVVDGGMSAGNSKGVKFKKGKVLYTLECYEIPPIVPKKKTKTKQSTNYDRGQYVTEEVYDSYIEEYGPDVYNEDFDVMDTYDFEAEVVEQYDTKIDKCGNEVPSGNGMDYYEYFALMHGDMDSDGNISWQSNNSDGSTNESYQDFVRYKESHMDEFPKGNAFCDK